jgi:repressor LexA
MHPIQKRLLAFIDGQNLKKGGLRQLGRLAGGLHPFTVSYHLKKMEESGLIRINKQTGDIKKIKNGTSEKSDFSVIPILGSANCGEAKNFADEHVEGYLKVSKNIYKVGDGRFAVRATGNSMNKAKINRYGIEDGDYVVVNCNKRNPVSGDYVLAIIDGCANIKRFYFDKDRNIIALVSESTEKHPEIFINDKDRFMINGKVEYVIKKPQK